MAEAKTSGSPELDSAPEITSPEVDDLIYTAWTIIANAGEGDWNRETPEWKAAAEAWRERFHSYLDSTRLPL